jgi:PII-like signaling protein
MSTVPWFFTEWPDFWAAHLVEAGGDLPVVVIFVDTDEHVSRVLPKLKEMAAHRLIVRENVVLEQGTLE